MDWKEKESGESEGALYGEQAPADEKPKARRWFQPSWKQWWKGRSFWPRRRIREGKGLVVGAVIFSLAALVLSGISFYRLQNAPFILDQVVSTQERLGGRVDVLQSQMDRLETKTSQEELVALTADLQRTLILLRNLSVASPAGAQVDTVSREIEKLLEILEERSPATGSPLRRPDAQM